MRGRIATALLGALLVGSLLAAAPVRAGDEDHRAIARDGMVVSAERHASAASKAGHINLKSAEILRGLLERHFQSVFSFSMNDEVVHTGFAPMAHYLFAMGVGVKG